MREAEKKLIKLRMFLLEAEEKGSEIYKPILAEIWRIIKSEEDEDYDRRQEGD